MSGNASCIRLSYTVAVTAVLCTGIIAFYSRTSLELLLLIQSLHFFSSSGSWYVHLYFVICGFLYLVNQKIVMLKDLGQFVYITLCGLYIFMHQGCLERLQINSFMRMRCSLCPAIVRLHRSPAFSL